jgi:hypothetical protein
LKCEGFVEASELVEDTLESSFGVEEFSSWDKLEGLGEALVAEELVEELVLAWDANQRVC